jgi:hypothetical protein
MPPRTRCSAGIGGASELRYSCLVGQAPTTEAEKE